MAADRRVGDVDDRAGGAVERARVGAAGQAGDLLMDGGVEGGRVAGRRARTGGTEGRSRRFGARLPRCDGAAGCGRPGGARDSTGARGAAGKRGPRGKTGPAAKIPRISCKLPGSKVTCKVARSRGSGGSGEGNAGGGEGLRLRLSRAHKLYAAGSRAATSTRTNVRLHALRRLTAGCYTLVVSVGEDVTVRIPLRLR